MNRRNILSLSLITALGLISLPGSTTAQQRAIKDQIIGAWTFVSSVDNHPDGRKDDRWGPNATGVFIFDGSGHFAQFISRSDIPKIAGNSPSRATDAENRRILDNMVGVFGTYSVNETDKIVTTRVAGGIYPNQVGIDQNRLITSITADELQYTNPTTTGTKAESTWRRIPNSDPPLVRIISDNPFYKPYEGRGEEINIIGRIRWFARDVI
jgi:Lipocalin-like domain